MIYHKDERFMDIIKKSGTTDIFPAARYIMQLESIKEAASILVNKVNSVEFPSSIREQTGRRMPCSELNTL